MKKLKLWIESFRLSVTIPAGLLVHVGSILAHQKTNWILALEAFLVATFAMVQNDYIDRFHDLKKGKRFAYEHKKEFIIVLCIGWITVWGIALSLPTPNLSILIPVILISMFYSYSRKVMYVQTFCVAIASASPLIFVNGNLVPLVFYDANALMFLSTFFGIFAREIVKDIEDAEIDVGYKYTPISMNHVTKENELRHVAGLVGVAVNLCLFCVLPILGGNSILLSMLCFSGLTLCAASGVVWGVIQDTELGKKFFDYGMLCTLGSIILSAI